jgi:hypothetical protein
LVIILTCLIAVIFLLTLGFAIIVLAYYLNNSNDNSTITNATNSTIVENITGGDTATIPMKPSDKDATLF